MTLNILLQLYHYVQTILKCMNPPNNYNSMSTYHQDVAVSVDSASFRSRLASKQLTQRYEDSSLASEENEFLKAYQNNTILNNSFAYPSPDKSNYRTINVSKLSERQSLSPSPTNKKSIIEDLTQKNQMLQREVERVQKILSLGERRKTKRLPELDSKVVKKELDIAYKQIKIYENDIEQRKKYYEHEGVYVEKIRRAESTLLERQDLVKKLLAEISELKKQSNEFVKLLQDGHIKNQYTNKSSRLHKEIKTIEKQLNDEEELAMSDYYNAQQKKKKIFEMEQELVRNGFDQRELTSMKQRLDRNEKPEQVTQRDEGKAEDRSKKAFNNLKNEINLMKKMQKDYSKKIEELQSQKQQAEHKNQESKRRLEQTEQEIVRLQKMFQEMKRNIDPNKLKPLYKNGTLTQSSITQFGTGKGNPLEHLYDTDELGQYNPKHTVVNDRPKLGKRPAFIVQLTLFENRTQFLGFQAGYLADESGVVKGNVNVLKRQNERFLKDKSIKLQPGDYFHFFEVCFNKDNVVVGFVAISKQEKIIKAGLNEGNKREFFFKKKEYPCCLFGSYSNDGFEMMGVEKAYSNLQ